jgi:hypothetical protein
MPNNPRSAPKSEMYVTGEYLRKHQTWHSEDSEWKAEQILKMVNNHNLMPRTICEVGCGAGGILRQMQANMAEDCTFVGYEISPQAFELCKEHANKRLQFELKDFTQETGVLFDLLICVDVIEHVEDYFGFLRNLRTKGRYKIFNIPLEFTSIGAARGWPRDSWDTLGHVHYFTKDTALQSLKDAGYTVVDHFYAREFDRTSSQSSSLILKLLRRAAFSLSPNLAVRLLGGCPLVILAE